MHSVFVPDVQTVFEFEQQFDLNLRSLTVSATKAIYNDVIYSYITDYIYKMLLSDKLSKKEKKQRLKQIVAYRPLKEHLIKEYADNTLYRILYLGLVLKAGFIVRCGFELCQNH